MTQTAAIPLAAVKHGEVFTKRWVVELILDMVGYTLDRDLSSLQAVEPACGRGAFLLPLTERLSASAREQGKTLSDLADSVRAFDLLPENVDVSRELVRHALVQDGWDKEEAATLAEKWVSQGDYLLGTGETASADVVVGNPPYIRLEDVPAGRMAAYRSVCPTMTGRADIYVGFIERGLRALKPGGSLGFIVADRWMRNQYGRNLRELIAAKFSVDASVQMHDVDAFEDQVAAYPAISVIRRGQQGSAVVANTTKVFGQKDAHNFSTWYRTGQEDAVANDRWEAGRLPHWFEGGDLWPSGSPALLAMIEELNEKFVLLEESAPQTRIGIGVATGADAVFVAKDPPVEQDRLLPLSMTADTRTGELVWSGHLLVNPWDENGNLVQLQDWPKLAAYLRKNRAALEGRSVARRHPSAWYRTIDKVAPSLAGRPKLLFPDMKLASRPVLDQGGLYPHHNLYYVTSEGWDLRVLGGLLFSRVVEATIGAYCVKMRGGTLRFQAQYLRRVRVPRPESISTKDAEELSLAFENRDSEAATRAAVRAYGLSPNHEKWLTGPAFRGL
ncbi:Eco57I restriction-modification methylase domain-containing protein [Micromonospora echinospora]|uniref:Eco57I restriction-modification methylase domain-containing protein n=1 Tax=Micromonospora echinospora TaxID=1877 RepID=UPI0033C9AE21